jgi:hypothetical protein
MREMGAGQNARLGGVHARPRVRVSSRRAWSRRPSGVGPHGRADLQECPLYELDVTCASRDEDLSTVPSVPTISGTCAR